MTSQIDVGMVVGLRFRRSQIKVMRSLRDSLASLNASHDFISLLDKAIDDTLRNEAVEVHCTDEAEAKELAAAFGLYGIAEPTLEFLSGRPTSLVIPGG